MASITRRGNSYRIRVSNGYDSNGRQKIESVTWTPDPLKTAQQNQKALDIFAFEFEHKVKNGLFFKENHMTYQTYIEQWLMDYASQQMERTSYECTENLMRLHILPVLGQLRLSEITPMHLNKLYSNMLQQGYIRNGKKHPYKPSTIRRIHHAISISLSTAVTWQLIEYNPCDRVKPPKMTKSIEPKHFTPEEAQLFLEFLNEPDPATGHDIPEQFRVFFYMALYGGFRRGELIALKWNDIDFSNNTVSITKSTAKVRASQMEKAPKNFSSVRIVVLSDSVMQMLQDYKHNQAVYRLAQGDDWQGDNFVFIQSDGKQMHIDTPTKVFKRLLRSFNKSHLEQLPDISLHGLRHTSATLLIAQHVDIKTVSSRLGHSNTSTTLNIYTHSLKQLDTTAAIAIADILEKK